MDFSYYWLLALPVFFGLGWLAARFDLKELLLESRTLPEAYSKGLNFLLNEKPDEALQVLADVSRETHAAVDLQFALGGLFRRRGEIDRATRIHQAILTREDLSDRERLQALFELGQDYQKGGLFDRAEELFNKLLDSEFAIPALLYLKDVYLSEKEWNRASVIMDELMKRRDDPRDRREKSHFLAESAELKYRQGQPADAKASLHEALRVCPEAVRPLLLLGAWALLEKNPEEAIQRFNAVAEKNTSLLFLAAPGLLEAYTAIGRVGEGLEKLKAWVDLCPSLDLIREVFEALKKAEGPASAYRWIEDTLVRHPSLASLQHYLQAKLQCDAENTQGRSVLQAASRIMSDYMRRQAMFVCQQCGFKAKEFHWHCPACATWDSVPARRDHDFNAEKGAS